MMRSEQFVGSTQSGHALLLAALMGVMAFALWTTAYRSTQDALALASTEAERDERYHVLTEAMARAGHLLETGAPPFGSYSCISRHRLGAGDWRAVVLQFERQGRSERWAVETRLATQAELRRLPAAPATFSERRRNEERPRASRRGAGSVSRSSRP